MDLGHLSSSPRLVLTPIHAVDLKIMENIFQPFQTLPAPCSVTLDTSQGFIICGKITQYDVMNTVARRILQKLNEIKL